MQEFIRARNPEQKKQRLEEIMAATDKLFHESSYHAVTLTTIAEELGWSRGNLYKYVTTKEEIFLELYAKKQLDFALDVDAALAGKQLSDKEFAAIWADVLGCHQDYLRYHGILSTIIETNVTLQNLTAFKKRSYGDRERIFALLRSQCPGLPEKLVRQLFFALLYHGCGLYTHTHCSELTAQALEAAGMPVPHDTFEPMFADFMVMCLQYYKKAYCPNGTAN